MRTCIGFSFQMCQIAIQSNNLSIVCVCVCVFAGYARGVRHWLLCSVQCCDHITINGSRYTGSSGPDLTVAPGQRISWSSDGSVVNGGFTLCIATPVANFEVVSGTQFCSLDSNGCVTDGVGTHGNYEDCSIQVLQSGRLTASEFALETVRWGA